MTTPTTPAGSWREVMALFDRWLEAEPARQAELLAQCQAQQPALHTRLLALIAADEAAEAGQFLGPEPAAARPPAAHAGLRLGAWTLREPIASGGMGQVWLAVVSRTVRHFTTRFLPHKVTASCP